MECGRVHVCVCVCLGVNDFDLTAAHQADWSKGTDVNHTPDTVRATHTHIHTHDSQFFSAQYKCVCVPANITQRIRNKTIWKSPGSGHPWVCCLSKLSNPSIRLVNGDVNPALFNTSSLWMALWFNAVTVVIWVFLKIKHPACYSNTIRKQDLANLGQWQRQFSLLKREELVAFYFTVCALKCTYNVVLTQESTGNIRKLQGLMLRLGVVSRLVPRSYPVIVITIITT